MCVCVCVCVCVYVYIYVRLYVYIYVYIYVYYIYIYIYIYMSIYIYRRSGAGGLWRSWRGYELRSTLDAYGLFWTDYQGRGGGDGAGAHVR
jgi:hypothetical protein